ncbi:flavin-containing monooxygenase FMO [Delitschia confertaspora ATCC 74209]|uniref:Flavin-containing monooxygenase FMO n=1 Tax=Delitschia confertaspora ATCC 74209 TaxID=1513339 RepID=A0A9P4JSL8_9PLEO|nr:flavin-containing monooxygenase FMO [Delitschia confertaspora ATCC 74209]
MVIKCVAVIGLGPAGAITVDAIAQEQAFDTIRVFERREAPGGCWIEDEGPHPNLDPAALAPLSSRNADKPVPTPSELPKKALKANQPRYAESSIYPYLETNVADLSMSFSQEPITGPRTTLSISKYGEDTPFVHHSIIRKYIESLVYRNDYERFVEYNTTVELVEKVGAEWRVVLRKEVKGQEDEWWEERFDAVIVANGHYHVPYIPRIEGLEEFERMRPGSVKHSKMFRGREQYKGKKVIVVGASVSAADIAVDLIGDASSPVCAVILGHKFNHNFGDIAFRHPGICPKPSISHISTDDNTRTVHFIDGTSVADVDEIIFGTGYTWSLPFLPSVEVKNNRVPGLYQHVIYQKDPTLLFVGAVAAGLTFKVFEWQAVLAARLLSGRATLPPISEMQKWEEERIKERGDGVWFTVLWPDFKGYFEGVRRLAGEPRQEDGKIVGRVLPKWDERWLEVFLEGHERRMRWWREQNERAMEKFEGGK